ncbi:hypothetical protein CEXT_396101 [Caerostris extrusa]|uniref:Ribosomal protein S12 n=1 Tax=Caerostris extrusa TaxID=172846 RepID=A0AAV4UMR1_CAEEX|nr:hypothetical protein CEXT_396101 [Caerostris extrusa]
MAAKKYGPRAVNGKADRSTKGKSFDLHFQFLPQVGDGAFTLAKKRIKKYICTKLKRYECRSFSEQPMFPGRVTWRQTSNGPISVNGKVVNKSTKGKVSICIFSSFPRLGTKICGGRKVIRLKSIR